MSINGRDIEDGSALVAMGDEHGRVVWEFAHSVQRVTWDPENAKNFALEMAKCAYTAQYGRKPDATPVSIVTEHLRHKLRARAALVVRSLTESGKSPDYIARHLTDLLLAEIG